MNRWTLLLLGFVVALIGALEVPSLGEQTPGQPGAGQEDILVATYSIVACDPEMEVESSPTAMLGDPPAAVTLPDAMPVL